MRSFCRYAGFFKRVCYPGNQVKLCASIVLFMNEGRDKYRANSLLCMSRWSSMLQFWQVILEGPFDEGYVQLTAFGRVCTSESRQRGVVS